VLFGRHQTSSQTVLYDCSGRHKIRRAPPQRGPHFALSLPAANEVSVMPVMEVAVMIIRAVVIVPGRANAYADTGRSRIETNLCRGRQSRADRDRRHKRNSKFPHDCLLVLVHELITWNSKTPFRLFRRGTRQKILEPIRKSNPAFIAAIRRTGRPDVRYSTTSGHRAKTPPCPILTVVVTSAGTAEQEIAVSSLRRAGCRSSICHLAGAIGSGEAQLHAQTRRIVD